MNAHLAAVLFALLALARPAVGADAVDLRVDCRQPVGTIRPLHGGNCGPVCVGGTIDLSDHFKAMGVPLTRLHDCNWPNPNVVDVHAVFPNPAADPEKPESYTFGPTDDYIAATVATGSKIVYRLGESIEHTKRKVHVHPPADVDRWAAACVGIVRHYNDGWANGFRHNIQYWEVWNEPENRPSMWSGSDDDYLRLYEAAAVAIKKRFPDVKVGGPSLGYTGKVVDGKFEPGELMVKFVKRCRERSLPLDFLSWHLYTDDPAECVVRAKGVRALLDEHGFTKAESHLNEWNLLAGNSWKAFSKDGQGAVRERFFEEVAGPAGAAFTAAVLTNLQHAPVDAANYYRSDAGGFGLFTEHGTPRKPFFAMKAFNAMVTETPKRLKAEGGDPGTITVLAGTDDAGGRVNVLVSNARSPKREVKLSLANRPWGDGGRVEVFVVDAKSDLAKVRDEKLPAGEATLTLDVPAGTVCLVRIYKQQGK